MRVPPGRSHLRWWTPLGLTSAEAARALAQFGPNSVDEERVHPIQRVVHHFWAPVPWMLEAAIALQIVIGEHLEAIAIATLLLLNVGLGVFQESRADAALALLKQRLALRARVKRDGAWEDVAASDLVPDDVVQLSLGKVVPADLRIIEGSLLIDQSMLTGESIPVERNGGDTVYAGGLVRRGEAIARGHRHRQANLFRSCRRTRPRRPRRKRRAEGGPRHRRQSDRRQFRDRRRAHGLCLRHWPQRIAARAPRADGAALGGAGCVAGDVYARGRARRPVAGEERRAADAALGLARGGHDRCALRRQDRDAHRERTRGRCRLPRATGRDRRRRAGACRGRKFDRRPGFDRRCGPLRVRPAQDCLGCRRPQIHAVRSGNQDGRSVCDEGAAACFAWSRARRPLSRQPSHR